MLIKNLVEDTQAIAERNNRLESMKEQFPEDDWDSMKSNSIYEELKRYEDWVVEIQEKNIKLIPDEVVPEGVFVSGLNWSIELEGMTIHRIDTLDEMSAWGYGLCDNAEQAVKVYHQLISDGYGDENFIYILVLSPITRKNQPEEGGFRYHKWGEYIGVQNLQHEYLYDDKHIDLVYFYSIRRII